MKVVRKQLVALKTFKHNDITFEYEVTIMPIDAAAFASFMSLSAELTGFTQFVLEGTGCAEIYYSAICEVVGDEVVRSLLDAFRGVSTFAKRDTRITDHLLRAQILSHEKLGPVARNIIKLWYVSIWFELPAAWREAYGPLANDRTFIPGAYTYREGLLGPSVGAHVQGAKGPGYGTWAYPPEILI